jgi:hypothetical protein
MAETRKTFSSDATKYHGGIDLREVAGGPASALFSAVVNHKGAVPAPADISGITALGSVTGLTKTDVGNKPHVALNARFAAATDRMTVQLALYDASDAVIGLTPAVTLVASGYTDGTKYLAAREIVDVGEAAKVAPVITALTGSGDLYIVIL